MASKRGSQVEDVASANEHDAPPADGEREQMLDGMPEDLAGGEEGQDEDDGRPRVPRELRPLFNEIGRLSGMLSLARRAVYENDPGRAVKALTLLESQVPAAREVAELSM